MGIIEFVFVFVDVNLVSCNEKRVSLNWIRQKVLKTQFNLKKHENFFFFEILSWKIDYW